jgi:predicted nucleic acid-binding protein
VFLREFRSGAFNAVDATSDVIRAGIEELSRHPHHSIGAADALHLVTALELAARSRRTLVFVTADRGLYEAAKAHGLAVYNPNNEDEESLEALAGL